MTMNGYKYILEKQSEWAKNKGIELIGSKITRGRPSYTPKINENLFQSLLPDIQKSFSAGDGNELGSAGMPGKMQAVHSSSALGVNIFQYWLSISQLPTIAAACGFCRSDSKISESIQFEEKFPINDKFGFHPNIDVVIHNQAGSKKQCFAIECKFSEAYGAHKHSGLKQQYLDCSDIWDDIPQLHAFAKTICPQDNDFYFLHPAQLIKHILGLKRKYGHDGFRLLYLWYDVLGEGGKVHQDEITEFTALTKNDGIKFHALSYQKLIVSLANKQRANHSDYIRYLTERYL